MSLPTLPTAPWAGQPLRGRLLMACPKGHPVAWLPHQGLHALPASTPGRAAVAAPRRLQAPPAVLAQLQRLGHPAVGVLRQARQDVHEPAGYSAPLDAALRGERWMPHVRLVLLDLLDPRHDLATRRLLMLDTLSPWGLRAQLEDAPVLGVARDDRHAAQLCGPLLDVPHIACVLALDMDSRLPADASRAAWTLTRRTLAQHAGRQPVALAA